MRLIGIPILGWLAVFTLTSGCEIKTMVALRANEPSPSVTVPAEKDKHLDINRYAINKIVCNPLSVSAAAPEIGQGLVGDLYTLASTQPNYTDVDDFIAHGTKSDRKLFFSKLDVPTRMFDQGFPAQTGELLKNDLGQVLMENFGMELRTDLHLGTDDSPGNYELAVLGDDGIRVHLVDEAGAETSLIDIRNVHPTQLGCGNQTLSMGTGTKKRLKIRYAQGPRYHIAFMMLWRKVNLTTPVENRCGLAGNHTFFDPDHNSAPTSEFIGMQAAGWKVVQPENFSIPSDAVFNPCSGKLPPQILEVDAKVQKDGQVHISWKTDIGAASQVLYKNLATGVETLTLGNTKVQKSHEFEIKGLDPAVNYSFRAISFSENFGKTMANPVILKPARP